MLDRVLIIDDEIHLTEVLAIRLRALGFDVDTATSGILGIERATGDPQPDVIILDVRMPEIDGFEVNARLKADPRTSEIPVIFLSANVQDTARQAALSAGAFAYLKKPYDAIDVIKHIRDASAAA
jgi:CheY-like chemotaxis protein